MPARADIGRDARVRARALVRRFAVRKRRVETTVSLTTVRQFLEAVDRGFERWMRLIETDDATRTEWRVLALRNVLPALAGVRAGTVPVTATALISAWVDAGTALGVRVRVPQRRQHARPPRVKPDLETVIVFDAGVLEYTTKIASSKDTAAIIQRLMAHLQLSYDEVGLIVGTTGETVRRWEHGQSIPPEKHAVLHATDAALSRLLDVIKPEALPSAVRTPAEIFDTESALAWILRGRMTEVAERYDRELSYQR